MKAWSYYSHGQRPEDAKPFGVPPPVHPVSAGHIVPKAEKVEVDWEWSALIDPETYAALQEAQLGKKLMVVLHALSIVWAAVCLMFPMWAPFILVWAHNS